MKNIVLVVTNSSMLEYAVDVDRNFDSDCALAYKFFCSSSRRIIEIACLDRCIAAYWSVCKRNHPIHGVPSEMAFCIFASQIAVIIEKVSLRKLGLIISNMRKPITCYTQPRCLGIQVATPFL